MQARKQITITSMITTCKHNNDHKFPSCSLQEKRKNIENLKTQGFKMGIEKNLQVATFRETRIQISN
jgi:hypothetical protein